MTDSERPKEEREARSHRTARCRPWTHGTSRAACRRKFPHFANFDLDRALCDPGNCHSLGDAPSTERE